MSNIDNPIGEEPEAEPNVAQPGIPIDTVDSQGESVRSTLDDDVPQDLRPEVNEGVVELSAPTPSSSTTSIGVRMRMPSPIFSTPAPRPLRRSTEFIVRTPYGRSQSDFVQQGMRQSMGLYGTRAEFKDDDFDSMRPQDPTDMLTKGVTTLDGIPIIDGRPLQIASDGRSEVEFAPVRLWDKVDRENLPGDIRQAFVKAATGFVLPKNDKLSAPQIVSSDSKFLVQALNLQSQLKMIRAHMITYDIYDVMTIVVPVDVKATVGVESKTYNLLDDYPQLHAVTIANSCTWYNRWVTNRYISENMALTYTFFQNNTEESLWAKCLDLYEEFSPIQQGGPLMAFLILQRIQDSSEQALDLLHVQVVALDLRKIPGEDVEQAISLIKSTYEVLRNSSTPARSYTPNDFVKSIFRVLQTSSVPEFNEIF